MVGMYKLHEGLCMRWGRERSDFEIRRRDAGLSPSVKTCGFDSSLAEGAGKKEPENASLRSFRLLL